MQFNLTAASQQKNMQKLGTSLQQAQESAKANNVKFNSTAATNPNSVERTPEKDTCSFSNKNQDEVSSAVKTLAKSATFAYLLGVGIGFCPGLFMLGAAAFLFANKNNDSFKEKITEAISKNANAMNVLQQNAARQAQQAEGNIKNTQNVKNEQNVKNNSTVEQQAQAATENDSVAEQAAETKEVENEKATNPIKNADNKNDCKMALKVLQNLSSQKANATRNHAGQEKIDSIQSEIDTLKNHIKSTYSADTIRSAKASLNFEAQRLETSYAKIVKGN